MKQKNMIGAMTRRPIDEGSWRFLTGDEANIRRLADAVGFKYTRDKNGQDFIHGATLTFIGKGGKVARYLQGTRFNPADFEDTRIGGFRDADSIALYFNNGAVDLGVVQDGILLVTGETLEQVQQRVLGPDLEGNALFTEAPAWWTVSLRGGLNINTNNELTFSVNNIFDRNYRLHGSGFDSPGFSAIASWVGRF